MDVSDSASIGSVISLVGISFLCVLLHFMHMHFFISKVVKGWKSKQLPGLKIKKANTQGSKLDNFYK